MPMMTSQSAAFILDVNQPDHGYPWVFDEVHAYMIIADEMAIWIWCTKYVVFIVYNLCCLNLPLVY